MKPKVLSRVVIDRKHDFIFELELDPQKAREIILALYPEAEHVRVSDMRGNYFEFSKYYLDRIVLKENT